VFFTVKRPTCSTLGDSRLSAIYRRVMPLQSSSHKFLSSDTMIGSISIRAPLFTTRTMTRSISIKAPLLVSPRTLQELRSSTNADVKILDASWSMPNVPRDMSKEFVEKHIPGARYLDLDEVATPNELGLKHMMPSAQVFSEALENFGITPTSHVVL